MYRSITHFTVALLAALTVLTGSVAWGQVFPQRSQAMQWLPVSQPSAQQATGLQQLLSPGLRDDGQIRLASRTKFDGETDETSCGSDCDAVCCDPACCGLKWRAFADYLHLRPVNAQVEFAAAIDGTILAPPAVPVQIAPIALTDPDYDPGYRVGFGFCLDQCTEIVATYTEFNSDTQNQITTAAPNIIRSMVSHPSTFSAASDFLQGDATHSVDFQLIDLDWRRRIWTGSQTEVNILAGARYAHLDQTFEAIFTIPGTETVQSAVNFDGGGLRLGIDGEWQCRDTGFQVYGRAVANVLSGKTRARYFQGQSFDPTVVNTTWEVDRLTSILELELGVGWVGYGGHLRAKAGYMISAWQDAVLVSDYIGAVQTNDFRALGDTIGFDGLVVGAELSY